LKAVIKEGSYSLKQIFSLKETAFWKRMPSIIHTPQGQKSAKGFMVAKKLLYSCYWAVKMKEIAS
jgi:hypothetical protein